MRLGVYNYSSKNRHYNSVCFSLHIYLWVENELISILNVYNKRLTGPVQSTLDRDMDLGLHGITAMGTIYDVCTQQCANVEGDLRVFARETPPLTLFQALNTSYR